MPPLKPELALKRLWPKAQLVREHRRSFFVAGYRLRPGVTEYPKASTAELAWLRAVESADAPGAEPQKENIP